MAKPPKSMIEVVLPDPKLINATTASDYIKRGWLYYSTKNYPLAESDFYKALDLDPDNPDTLYALALALKADGKSQPAIENFEKTIKVIDSFEDRVRAQMLKRLAIGHINQIKTGDWNLEKEMWHTKR